MIFLRILGESFQFAWHALKVNKLRTILSLLGVTIGILTMVAVFTVFDSLERNIRSSVQDLGSNVMYVQKWPWGGGGEYPWWEYLSRPEPRHRELAALQERVNTAQHMAFAFGNQQDVQYQRNSVKEATIFSVSHEYNRIWQHELKAGRYFSRNESRQGTPVTILGADVTRGLFPGGSPLGREIRVMGRKLRVIGVFEKQGQSLVGNSMDGNVVVPVNFTRQVRSVEEQNNALIMVQARPEVSMTALRDDLEGSMRAIRRLQPRAENNFALNEISMITSSLDSLFGVVGIAGTVIGGFSVLVGAFGIANIMFVSVRERTNQIGIQKSLGAKRYFILLQFLLESVMLCLVGGVVGIALVAAVVPQLGEQWDFEIQLSLFNVLQGLGIAFFTGIIAGFLPALQASRLDPVEAIRRGG
ncbi:MAG: ABC transporter permease [Schleiferiaceae bacterium]|nr:ABC transporter permease [Schleiferiaceae bacterium]